MAKIYTRDQGGTPRYYADLRSLGGGQVALKPPGSKQATSNEAEAFKLLAREVEKLEGMPTRGEASLGRVVEEFIKENPGEVTAQWLHDMELRLTKAVEFLGSDRELATIEPKHLRDWLNKKLSHLAGGTQRHHLHALSSVYRYAQEQGYVTVGYNPVSGLYRKPKASNGDKKRTDEFFEIPDAAAFLKAAEELDLYYEVIGTFLLTGGRRKEVLGLLVGDVDFNAGIVHIRPNRFRGLKRAWSERVVPLWPQLREILEPYLEAREAGSEDLLFPGLTKGMITDLRKPLGQISARAKLPEPRLTKFRHTYATARLQTTDGGKQISLWQVAKELGHKTVARVEDTYGHPGQFRPRGEVVEYRVEARG